jgi:hypothetical protein
MGEVRRDALRRAGARFGVGLVALATCLLGGTHATFVAESVAQDARAPLPAGTRSMEVVEDGAIVRASPSDTGPRRGTLVAGARVPVRRRVAGPGCPGGAGWVEIGDDAFACESSLAPSREPPGGAAEPRVPEGALLPYRYAFVRDDATRAFARPQDYETDEYVEAYGEGFGLALDGRTRHGGVDFARTRRGLWVPEESLRPARASPFAGTVLEASGPVPAPGEPVGVGWAVRDRVIVRADGRGARAEGERAVEAHRTAGGARPGPEIARLSRLDAVRVLGFEGRPGARRGPAAWVRVQLLPPDSRVGLVAARDVAVPTLAVPPAEVGASAGLAAPAEPPERSASQRGARWLDIDVATQTLVAYEGTRPVFATLVSTGQRGRGTETPLGVHRVWVKLATSDMDDLERDDVERNYRIEAVPWVQYFQASYGLHATFWHDRFGERRSRGCVNLSPRDARWLFDFTAPVLPAGWSAILPTPRDPGTPVRVRDGTRLEPSSGTPRPSRR